MAIDLSAWFATENSNASNVLVSLTEGVVLNSSDTVNTANNTDVILGVGKNGIDKFPDGDPGETGVSIAGALLMGNGGDAVAGTGGNGGNAGGLGGNGGAGIQVTGLLDLGNGGDAAVGSSFFSLKGNGGNAVNAGGRGGDGVLVKDGGQILSGNGSDFLYGNGGDGGGAGRSGGAGGNGISVKGTGSEINTGNGDDLITGVAGGGGSAFRFDGEDGFGIYNNVGAVGCFKPCDPITDNGINMGRGDDTLDASFGGFGGGGAVAMGQGDDVVRGFGYQIIDGGQGYDSLYLGDGIFEATTLECNWTSITASGTTMYVTGFENIVGNVSYV